MAARSVKPSETLPDAGARDSKKKRATMEAFNARIEEILKARGATPDNNPALATHNEILGYTPRNWRIETPLGTLHVHPSGHSVMCPFQDWKRAEAAGYEHKWNHHYFGVLLEIAVADFASALDRLLNYRAPVVETKPAWRLTEVPGPAKPLSAFDEARRYLDSRAAGWTDPMVDPWEVIAELCEHEFDSQEGLYAQEDIEELKGKHEAEVSRVMKDPQEWDLAALTHSQLVALLRDVGIALSDAARRETNHAVDQEGTRVRAEGRDAADAIRNENTRLREQIGAMFRAGVADASKETPCRAYLKEHP